MRPAERLRTAAILAAAGLVLPARAHAQSAEAEVLFREGRALIKSGKVSAGCDKLQASERLESSVGTLLNLGDCHERLGRYASAWAAFRKAEALAKRAGNDEKRRAEAARRAGALEIKLSYLVIEVRQPVDGLVVRREGEVVDPAAWNVPVPLDPDTYTIVAEAPGYRAWRAEVPVTARLRRKLVTVPRLEREPAPPRGPAPVSRLARPAEPVTPAPAPSVAAPPPREEVVVAGPAMAAPAPRRDATWTTTRRLSLGVGVVSLGALGGGVYFGLRASDLQRRADARCPLVTCADPDGLRFNRDAQEAANRANVLYVAGGASLALATVLWLVGGPGEGTVIAPVAGDRHAGVSLGGTF